MYLKLGQQTTVMCHMVKEKKIQLLLQKLTGAQKKGTMVQNWMQNLGRLTKTVYLQFRMV